MARQAALRQARAIVLSNVAIVARAHTKALPLKGRVSAERLRLSKSLSNASADDSLDTFAERHVPLILGLTRVEPNGALFPIKLIKPQPQHATEPPLFFARVTSADFFRAKWINEQGE